MGIKQLKDPIYGYVKIDSNIFTNIIDTACFQRLRNIRQTSYGPLYSAALHNRFTHSIGVYHLGIIAISAIEKVVPKGIEEATFSNFCIKYKRLFSLACLLHDVGHAPFSHSGEAFYILPKPDELYARMIGEVGDERFEKDASSYHAKSKAAAPHEIMSVIIALERFKEFFQTAEQKAFLARCITGYKYQNIEDEEINLQNCIISSLNSSLIDVDRLDYLIRDSAVTGFESVSIDYIRLLNSLLIVYDEKDKKYEVAYGKGAISIIENVIFAHDAERKWIQNHPVVLYEHYLVQCAIRTVNAHYISDTKKSLFCVEALTQEGCDFGDNRHISLLCDDDIIYLAKNVYPNDLTNEYFSRKDRRHPVWKSEAEYRALFDRKLGDESLDELEEDFSSIEKFLNLKADEPIINEITLQLCKDELTEAEQQDLGPDQETTISGYKTRIKWMECLKSFSESVGIEFDYVLIGANKFKSGFMKEELMEIPIYFPNLGETKRFGHVVTALSSSRKRDKFFYLYYQRRDKPLEIGKITSHIKRALV